MGYSTDFEGVVTITPPLNNTERAYLTRFAGTRRMDRTKGPYYVDGDGPDIRNPDRPALGQPGLWCHWIPTEDGSGLRWDRLENFHHPEEWLQYLIDHFLRPGAVAARLRADGLEGFEKFTFDHTVSGTLHAQGEDPGDVWELVVDDNQVHAM